MSNSLFFNGCSETVEVIIRDGTGKKIDKRMYNLSDDNGKFSLVKWLYEKYDFEKVIKLIVKTKTDGNKILELEGDFLKI